MAEAYLRDNFAAGAPALSAEPTSLLDFAESFWMTRYHNQSQVAVFGGEFLVTAECNCFFGSLCTPRNEDALVVTDIEHFAKFRRRFVVLVLRT